MSILEPTVGAEEERIKELESTNFELSVGLAAKSNRAEELEGWIKNALSEYRNNSISDRTKLDHIFRALRGEE